MPKRSKHRTRLSKTAKLRWSVKKIKIEDHLDDKDFEMDVDDNADNITLGHISDIFELCHNESNF